MIDISLILFYSIRPWWVKEALKLTLHVSFSSVIISNDFQFSPCLSLRYFSTSPKFHLLYRLISILYIFESLFSVILCLRVNETLYTYSWPRIWKKLRVVVRIRSKPSVYKNSLREKNNSGELNLRKINIFLKPICKFICFSEVHFV